MESTYNGKNAEIWDVSERTLAHIPNFGSLSRQRRKNHYLKATGYKVGVLINFGSHPKLEWKRFVY